MKLDPRIKSLSDILTCFDIERAKEFIGQRGYFSDYFCVFTDLSDRAAGFLTAISDNDYAFYQDEDVGYFRFFIPESSLKPREKNYRPYTPQEFCNEFNIGERVTFRKKGDPESGQNLVLQGLWYRQLNGAAVTYARLGSYLYALEELFNGYEWRRYYQKDFVPFGVEVEK